jgi:thiol-disulfide isomerase/thioredoxin
MSDYQGRVLVLDFFATWCEPCRQTIPHLIELQRRYGEDLVVVGLNVGGPDDRVKVPSFARSLKIDYELGFPDQDLTQLFLADDETIPQTFVFDRSGRLAKRFIGYSQAMPAELDEVIQSSLAKRNQ